MNELFIIVGESMRAVWLQPSVVTYGLMNVEWLLSIDLLLRQYTIKIWICVLRTNLYPGWPACTLVPRRCCMGEGVEYEWRYLRPLFSVETLRLRLRSNHRTKIISTVGGRHPCLSRPRSFAQRGGMWWCLWSISTLSRLTRSGSVFSQAILRFLRCPWLFQLMNHILSVWWKFGTISGWVNRRSATEAVDSGSISGWIKPNFIEISNYSFPDWRLSIQRDSVKPPPCVVDRWADGIFTC